MTVSNFANVGRMAPKSRHNSALMPVSGGRSLFMATIAPFHGVMILPGTIQPPFVDETEAIMETGEPPTLSAAPKGLLLSEEQSGEGLLDIARAALALGAKALPGALGPAAKSVLEKGSEIAGKAAAAAAVAAAAKAIATGRVGTKISNVLSEKFNKNPSWRPGFPGEAHLVLPTKFGLTRANFCGPSTQLRKRLARGDKGVSEIDSACRVHDMLYSLAKSEGDIRAADDRLIADIKKAKTAGPKQKAVLIAGIKAKTLGEDVGIFGPETFTSLPGLSGRGFTGMSGFQRSGLSGQGVPTRFNPNLISQSNLTRLSRRLTSNPGSVRGPDPTISNRVSGSGVVDPTVSGLVTGGGFRDLPPRTTDPSAAVDESLRRAIDPVNRGLSHGSGLPLPGEILKAGVLNKLKTARKQRGVGRFIKEDSSARLLGPMGAGKTTLKGLMQILPAISNGFASLGLLPKGSEKKMLKMVLALLKRGLSVEKIKSLSKQLKVAPVALSKIIEKALKSQSGSGLLVAGQGPQSGGQFGALASIAGGIIIPEIIKLIRKKKKKKKKSKGRGASPTGASGRTVAGAGIASTLAGLAASVVIPQLIKLVKKKKKKKRKRK